MNPTRQKSIRKADPRRKLKVLVALTARGKSPESFELEAALPEATAKETTRDLISALHPLLRQIGLLGGPLTAEETVTPQQEIKALRAMLADAMYSNFDNELLNGATGYSLMVGHETYIRDVVYRNMPLYPTADMAIDAELPKYVARESSP